jgi:hypothetical protein
METALAIKNKVMSLCGISADVYHTELYNSGLAYAESICDNEDMAVSFLTGVQEYWTWWRNQFDITNQYLVHVVSYNDSPADILRQWKALHVPESLKAYPGENVIEASYAVMVGNVITKSHHEKAIK